MKLLEGSVQRKMRLLSNSEISKYRKRMKFEVIYSISMIVTGLAVTRYFEDSDYVFVIGISYTIIMCILGLAYFPQKYCCVGLFGGFKHTRLADRIERFVKSTGKEGCDPRKLILRDVESMGENHREIVNHALSDALEYFNHKVYGHVIRTRSGKEFSIKRLNTEFQQNDLESPVYFHGEDEFIEVASLNTVAHALLSHRIYLCFQEDLERKSERDKFISKNETLQRIKSTEEKLAKLNSSNNSKAS